MKQIDKTKVIFVSDYFIDEFKGGAEMTSEALIESSPFEVTRVTALDVNDEIIQKNIDKLWIFGNFTRMKYTLIPQIMKFLDYVVIEYDYKFCLYRSPEIHMFQEGRNCDCHKFFGRNIANFFKNSRFVWWMSEKQKLIYEDNFLTLKEADGDVLSSVFRNEDLDNMRILRSAAVDRSGWAILDSGSWIKGIPESKRYAEDRGLKVNLIRRMSHYSLMEELSRSEGLIFMPSGGDSCPRITIEGKLLGCKLATNDNVQHKSESWFNGSVEDVENYLRGRSSKFWGKCREIINSTSNEVVNA